MKHILLSDWLRQYKQVQDLAAGTAASYGSAVGSLETFAGRTLHLDELTAELVNNWATARLGKELARITVRNQLCAVVTLWRAAHAADVTCQEPKGVRKVKLPRTVPEAWNVDGGLQRLLAACDQITGVHKRLRVEWGKLLRAWLLVGYHTGLRPCDLVLLPMTSLLARGPFVVIQDKTNWPVVITLPAEAINAARATVPPQRETFLPMHRSTLYDGVRELIRLAGLPGTPKWLRRTGATVVEREHPGGAMAFLGHKTPGMAMKHYIDPRLAGAKRPTPPPFTSEA